MVTIEWRGDYSVGVEELDGQHQRLLHIINTIIEDQQDKYNSAKFSASLATLIHYAYTHFATEERYLSQSNYPELEQHIIWHIDFIVNTLNLALKIKVGSDDIRKELLIFLQDWFSLHVLGFDRKYIPYIKKNENTT
jgi:hemerythrin